MLPDSPILNSKYGNVLLSMFRFFVIAIEIVLLVIILRSSVVQYFFSDIQQSLTDWMLELSLVAEKRELQSLRDEISPITTNMKGYQRDYLEEITSEKLRLKMFHRQYCIDGDKNPYVYGASLKSICDAIDRTQVLNS